MSDQPKHLRKQMPSVAVIGCGYWGKNLVRNFCQLGSLSAICDLDESRLRELRKAYPGARALGYDEILADSGGTSFRTFELAIPPMERVNGASLARILDGWQCLEDGCRHRDSSIEPGSLALLGKGCEFDIV